MSNFEVDSLNSDLQRNFLLFFNVQIPVKISNEKKLLLILNLYIPLLTSPKFYRTFHADKKNYPLNNFKEQINSNPP
jgi:hypothetical protein